MGAVINNLFRIVLRKFHSVKYYGLALLFFLTSDWALKAQSCNIIPNAQKICVGSTITFSRSPLSATDSAYLWSFGDNSTSNQSTPTYQYPQAGNYTVNLRVYKIGGTFCDAPPVQIRVFTKPIANYAITPNDTQCFNQNRFVFNDLSVSGASNAPIKRRTMIYGDGAFVNNNAPFNNQLSHSYTDANGNNYLVVLEVEDTNGCVAQLVDTVVVYPKITADMTFVQDMRCGQTVVEFRNSSLVDTIGLQSTWIFWDGQIQTRTNDTAYKKFFYTYNGDTIFYPQLIIKDKNGCKDTTDKISFVRTFIPDPIIHIKPINKQCYNSNEFAFENKTKVEDRLAFAWSIVKPEDYYQIDSSGKEINYIKMPSCGVYYIILRFNYSGCSFLTDTTVTVYGPKAIIEDTTTEVQRHIQCNSSDTVRLAFKDGNCYYANSNLTYLWDFDDGYAPPCTTNTKLGINVNQNCRYSTDSVMVKHHYRFPNKRCYNVSLIVRDTLIGCTDTVYK
jgi:PKD repeat protein